MQSKYLIYLSLLVLPLFAWADNAERDPFMPFVVEQPIAVGSAQDKKNAYDVTPLTERPLSSYRLIGLIVSPDTSIALIKSRDKREYFANIGDSLGNEGGVIDVISNNGITIDMNGKFIDLTVSNRFDSQDENN